MLDLNFVRENFTKVCEVLSDRNFPTTQFAADFVNFDEQRRKAIAESDRLNAERNVKSQQIGALMKEGKTEEAQKLRADTNELKSKIAKADEIREGSERRLRELLEVLPNIPHE